ncbi:DNA excision repair protein ERCC-6-like isoform X2 [Cimex lectularius]|uniref:DNA repair and recombination protein RAD54-like n=1 Tax=Cimex lectularius TaxID=79782 RepID=A0A8I6RVV0_CIMLE|nr:DNA excision repair protein ERCC-6-like isoform X2 [Cimex lectularius]
MDEAKPTAPLADASREKHLKFKIDVSAIESVHENQLASELQALDLDVYDSNTLEKGIIAQVEKAIQENDIEEGECFDDDDDGEPPSKLRKLLTTNKITTKNIKRNGELDSFNKYLQDQARMQKDQIKMIKNFPKKNFSSAIVKVAKPTKGEQAKDKILNSKFPVKIKKKKKAKSPTLVIEPDHSVQPCEIDRKYRNSSGSEYFPSSSEDSEDDYITTRAKPAKCKVNSSEMDLSSDDSEWASDNESKNRKKTREQDDGNLEIFEKRVSKFNKDIFKKFHIVNEGEQYRCPSVVWDKLYKYQQDAVAWFWGLNKERCGGILGDEMGLGKTIQLIAFFSGLYISNIVDFDTDYKGLGPILIVCPTTLMHHWVRELHKWLPPVRVAILHETGTYLGKNKNKLIDSIHNICCGILITSYNGLVLYKEKILSKNWHYIVLDEGHKIRNHNAQATLVAKQVLTPHRIILSGSPLQNNLRELWSLFDFVYPGKLGTLNVFIASFQVPIVQGGYMNATQVQIKTAYKCASILKETISPYLLRRMKAEVDQHVHLPPKTEQVLFCKLTDEQRAYYKHYLSTLDIEGIVRGRVKIFVGLINLRKICNHPDLYSGGPNKDFRLDEDANNQKPENCFGYYKRAGKMIVIHKLLKIWFQQNHRVLIFTQSKKMLRILEDYIKTQKYQYLKLDGGTSIASRQPLIDKFNQDTSYFVMLLTTKVGGLGVNLTGANRVIIYDPDWNPATDTQARERAWRIGQQRDVTIYRFITTGTIEEKIYHRQIFKQFLSNKVLKDPRQRRFFKSNDLLELFTLAETVSGGTSETAAIFAGIGSEVELPKKPPGKLKDAVVIPQPSFSASKIEEMKKLAQELSKKITISQNQAENKLDESNKEDENLNKQLSSSCDAQAIPSTSKQMLIYGPDGNLVLTDINTSQEDKKKNDTDDVKPALETESRKKKKKKYKNGGSFEGHVVPHLVKCKSVKKQKIARTLTQDEYVLHKLFSKSGVESAMRHDAIMEGGPSDYALVEAEADKVAQEALKKLRESSVRVIQPRKLTFLTPLPMNGIDSKNPIYSSINKRNLEVENRTPETVLVKNIIEWMCTQGGTVSTDSIVNEFASKVGYEKNAIFKSILSKIAVFFRAPDKKGYWTIKEDFRRYPR